MHGATIQPESATFAGALGVSATAYRTTQRHDTAVASTWAPAPLSLPSDDHVAEGYLLQV